MSIHSSIIQKSQKTETTRIRYSPTDTNLAFHAIGILVSKQKNEVLTHATTWIDRKIIRLSERSPSQMTA